MTAYRRMLRISWKDHRTNQSIPEELDTNARLLNDIRRRKLRYFGHVVRADNLCTSNLHGRIAGTRKRGRPRRRWTDDTKDWTELSVAECVRTAQDRTAWCAKVSLAWPSTLRNEEEPVQSSAKGKCMINGMAILSPEKSLVIAIMAIHIPLAPPLVLR